MQFNISGHHVEVTEALKEMIKKKFNKISSHYDHITQIQVTLNVEKKRHIVDVVLHISGADIVASSENHDMYAAIDDAAHKIDKQIIKHKEKQSKHH